MDNLKCGVCNKPIALNETYYTATLYQSQNTTNYTPKELLNCVKCSNCSFANKDGK
jgi:hypothetical protein